MSAPEKNDGISVITTHVNADFDALASMMAAQKLYPDSLVVFPGSQDKNLRNFFIESMVYLLNIKDIKHIDFDRITRLILVDTRQPGRIGNFATILDRPNLEIHIYDHHPPTGNDVSGQREIIGTTGATVTILIEILQRKGIELTQDEATILCMGIYEDTGSFAFSSTTPRDLRAAAYLLSKGANLNIVSDLITREISPEQVALLNDMLQSMMHYNINGVDVALSRISSNKYIPDFAFLVHKLISMENLDAVFALGQMENKIYVVGRSRVPEVDAGAIVTPMGGGGHPAAASATVREKTLPQAENHLLRLLYDNVKSRQRAEVLMSSPAITIDAGASCAEASKRLNRYNVNALLVMDAHQDRSMAGYISRQIIEKALYHNLDQSPVSDYMNTAMADVSPEAGLAEIQEKIIENKQRILPVVQNGTTIGVITRTDLLNSIVNRSEDIHRFGKDPLNSKKNARQRSIINLMRERLPERLMQMLRNIGKVADDIGCDAYVVGGFVRDLFLFHKNEDIDIVVEGDGIEFARTYAKQVGARIHSHEKFGTAVIIFQDGFKIDVASARMEYYSYPAALPIVEKSSIKLDLFRRDFTINTLAVQLNAKRFGTLIDFFAAQKDIKEKAVRVLHNLSFVEDPTRVFRAIRFEQRFEFKIGKLTAGLIDNALKMDFFKRLSGKRVFTEMRLILEEEETSATVKRLGEFGLLKVLHPSIRADDDLLALFQSVTQVLSWFDLQFFDDQYHRWMVYFLALIRKCPRRTTEEICTRLELAPRHQNVFLRQRPKAERSLKWLERSDSAKNSKLYQVLTGFRTELVLYMMAATGNENVKRGISSYFTSLRYVTTAIGGKDLMDLNIHPGPQYKEILDAVLAAKLDGGVTNRDDELVLARTIAHSSS